jgi:hypothetical protein
MVRMAAKRGITVTKVLSLPAKREATQQDRPEVEPKVPMLGHREARPLLPPVMWVRDPVTDQPVMPVRDPPVTVLAATLPVIADKQDDLDLARRSGAFPRVHLIFLKITDGIYCSADR